MLDLPAKSQRKRERLAQLHSQACAALISEEADIIAGFRTGLEHDVAAARRIASGLMDYAILYNKRQTNAWIARSMVGAADSPDTRARSLNNLGNRLSDLGYRKGAIDAARESSAIYGGCPRGNRRPLCRTWPCL